MSSTQSAHPLSAGSGPDQIHSNNASPTSAEGPAGLDTSQNGDKRTRRGVRHLSEQQLEKKRKNDREAQRAIRERTKNQIEALEMRVKELESGQAYQQMQELRRERDELQAENEKIKASLIRVQALIQPLLEKAHTDTTAPSHIKPEHEPPPARVVGSIRTTKVFASPRRSIPGTYSDSIHDSPQSANLFAQNDQPSSQAWSPSGAPGQPELHSHSQDRSLRYYNGPDDSQRGHESHNKPVDMQRHGSGSVDSSRSLPASPGDSTRSRLRSSLGHAMEPIANLLNPPGTLTPDNQATSHQPMDERLQQPPHLRLPNNVLPTCAFDSILYDFLTECHKRIAAGLAPDDLLGPPHPDLTALLFPDRAASAAPSLSSLLIELQKGFSYLTHWPDKIGLVHTSFYFLRWCVSPTADNFHLVPRFMRPTDAQVAVPHPIWIGCVPWPELRSRLCHAHPRISLDDLFLPYTMRLCVNWPYNNDPFACLYRVPGKRGDDGGDGGDELRILPAYKEHVEKLENWSLGPEFAEAFPDLADAVRVRYP